MTNMSIGHTVGTTTYRQYDSPRPPSIRPASNSSTGAVLKAASMRRKHHGAPFQMPTNTITPKPSLGSRSQASGVVSPITWLRIPSSPLVAPRKPEKNVAVDDQGITNGSTKSAVSAPRPRRAR